MPDQECAAAAELLLAIAAHDRRMYVRTFVCLRRRVRSISDIFLSSRRQAAGLFYSKQRGQQRRRYPHIKERNISFLYSPCLP